MAFAAAEGQNLRQRLAYALHHCVNARHGRSLHWEPPVRSTKGLRANGLLVGVQVGAIFSVINW